MQITNSKMKYPKVMYLEIELIYIEARDLIKGLLKRNVY